jgi:outer membrane immunogenic protein
MRRIVLAAAALMMLGNVASAADLAPGTYTKAPSPAVSPVYNWTGFYAGINGGWGENKTTGDSYCLNPAGVLNGVGCGIFPNGNVSPSGGLFGGQAGYNFQSGHMVYGFEADIQWSDIKGSSSAFTHFPQVGLAGLFTTPGTFAMSQSLDWFGTARGRVGYAWDRVLLYATGGLIYGRENVSSAVNFTSGVSYLSSDVSVRAGWTVGGGLEYAFTNNWSGRVEGLYYDMGSETISSGSSPAVTGFTRAGVFGYQGAIVRGAIDYRFDGPIVARY